MNTKESNEVGLLAELLALAIRLDPVLFQEVRERLALDKRTGAIASDLIEAELEAELSRARLLGYPLGMIIIQIDAWEQDSDDGKWLLEEKGIRAVVEHLKSLIRSTDWVAAYKDTNRFIIVLPGCGTNQIQQVASKIRGGFDDFQFAIPDVIKAEPQLYIGYAFSEDGNSSVAKLIKTAERSISKNYPSGN